MTKKLNLPHLRSVGGKRIKDYGTLLFDYTPEFITTADDNWDAMLDALEEAKEIMQNMSHEVDCRQGKQHSKEGYGYPDRCKCDVDNECKDWLSQFEGEE